MDAHAETLDLDVIWRKLGIRGFTSINTFKTIVEDCESQMLPPATLKFTVMILTIYRKYITYIRPRFFFAKRLQILVTSMWTLCCILWSESNRFRPCN